MVGITFVLMVMTALYAWVTYRAYKVTKDQLAVALQPDLDLSIAVRDAANLRRGEITLINTAKAPIRLQSVTVIYLPDPERSFDTQRVVLPHFKGRIVGGQSRAALEWEIPDYLLLHVSDSALAEWLGQLTAGVDSTDIHGLYGHSYVYNSLYGLRYFRGFRRPPGKLRKAWLRLNEKPWVKRVKRWISRK
jgi:hypothetical protein